MSTQSHKVKFTYEDYLLFPDNGKRHELIDGEHYMTPAPSTKHQRISSKLHLAMGTYVNRNKAGIVFAAPIDVVLSDLDVVQPDLLFISSAKSSIITEKNIQGAPDLIIEITSETTRKTDEVIKRKLYEHYGVQEYWIVDPEVETVKIYRLTDRGYARTGELALDTGDSLTTPLLPKFQIPLTEIFK